MVMMDYLFIQDSGCFGCSGYDSVCASYESLQCMQVRNLTLAQIKDAQEYHPQNVYRLKFRPRVVDNAS